MEQADIFSLSFIFTALMCSSFFAPCTVLFTVRSTSLLCGSLPMLFRPQPSGS